MLTCPMPRYIATRIFRKHEWEKHGTCAQDLPETRGEYNYFKKGLELYHKYNIDRYRLIYNEGYY